MTAAAKRRGAALARAARRPPAAVALALLAVLAVLVTMFTSGCGGSASGAGGWPSRARPLSSTAGWFRAINAHNQRRLLSYVRPQAKDQMGWASPSRGWPRFANVRCHTLEKQTTAQQAVLWCDFKESGPNRGNPDTSWTVTLDRTGHGWLITSYGQG